jgi:hypothetical protein
MEFRNKPFLLAAGRWPFLHVREPTKRSRGSIGSAADERPHAVRKMLAADCHTAHMSRFPSHRFNKNAKFPTEFFFRNCAPPNKINYLATRWQEWRAYHRPRESTRCN